MKAALFSIIAIGLMSGLSSPVTAQFTSSIIKTPLAKCPVHKVTLKPDNVKISYGVPFMSNELIKARRTLFPCSRREVLGGRAPLENSPKFIKVNYCEKCRAAELKWNKTHKHRR